ncbi:dCTP deaminase [Halanaerobium sp. Z-7514]|uniref:dCTP deaminase, dUMP-forming n=1 Tax=Halanaerobium polyolivorans TaxID=2886943 RepID=A0AAW4WY77_9FIRM|nr:dCTP deaminase [Halanaerobium polyolivorans]MCC3145038.1 dCTP deaminase [Halanaerobium polyolivorans]RQD76235.1 MAG: dCTP deaminase [Halanaerobium sp. MSAO_Bac5]
MILSDKTIKKMLKEKTLIIDPVDNIQIQPASVDMRLGNDFLKVNENSLPLMTLTEQVSYEEVIGTEIIIPPHSFLLATTKEYIKLPDNVTAFVEGRSSIGRMGLFIQNAGWVDPGFEGQITLELFNANRLPIKLEAERRICQLVFAQMDNSAQNPYRGKYQGQKNTVGTKVFEDIENKNS